MAKKKKHKKKKKRTKEVQILKKTKKYIVVKVKGKIKRISKKKLPVTVITLPKRTGAILSMHDDRKRHALPPGWRISKHGRVYRETRRNRSDLKYL